MKHFFITCSVRIPFPGSKLYSITKWEKCVQTQLILVTPNQPFVSSTSRSPSQSFTECPCTLLLNRFFSPYNSAKTGQQYCSVQYCTVLIHSLTSIRPKNMNSLACHFQNDFDMPPNNFLLTICHGQVTRSEPREKRRCVLSCSGFPGKKEVRSLFLKFVTSRSVQ